MNFQLLVDDQLTITTTVVVAVSVAEPGNPYEEAMGTKRLLSSSPKCAEPEPVIVESAGDVGPSSGDGSDSSDTLDLYTGLPLRKVLKMGQDQEEHGGQAINEDDSCQADLVSLFGIEAEQDLIESLKESHPAPLLVPPSLENATLDTHQSAGPDSLDLDELPNFFNPQVSEESCLKLSPPTLNPNCVDDVPVLVWRDQVLDVLCPRFKASHWKRPLRLATACSGTGSLKIALQSLGVPLEETVSAERRKSGLQMALNYNDHPAHHFLEAAEVAKNMGYCSLHGRVCCLSPLQDDLFVCGFPCSPFSSQRPKRFAGIQGWLSHEDTQSMFDTIDILKVRQPRLGLLENVMGFVRESRTVMCGYGG